MTDLLTHVLAAYLLGAVVSRYWNRFDRRHVPLVMAGSVVPDAAKVYLLTGAHRTTVAGVEISWLALQTLGVTMSVAAIGALLIAPRERRAAFAALAAGVGLHIGLDYPVVRTGGLAPPYLFPVTWVQLPAGDLYLSSDVWPSLVALGLAVATWIVRRRSRR